MWVSGEARGSQEDLILHPGARTLLGHWLALRGERPAPARGDLDLRQMRRLAPWLFILEPAGADRGFPFRLAGTGLCSFLRREMTGIDVLSGWQSTERDAIASGLAAVTGRLQPAHARMRYLTDRGQTIGADMLALPMVARDGVSVHVLGGLFPHGNPEIWSYDRLVPADLAGVRLFEGEMAAVGARMPAPTATQAPRKFRLISGGLDRP